MNIIDNNNKSFGAGLSTVIKYKEKLTNTSRQEKFFEDTLHIEADFAKNKAAALANRCCADIFTELFRVSNIRFAFPPSIKLYKKENLIDENSAQNFCIPDTKEVLDNDYPFAGRSIFFSGFENLEYVDECAELNYKNRQTSSPHFLAPFIHEWVHSLHLDFIYKKYGYGGSCSYLNQLYPMQNEKLSGFNILEGLKNKTFSRDENEIIAAELGEYAAKPKNQYLEVFSEFVTKHICQSLSGVYITKNPIELLINTSVELQKILYKTVNFS